MIDKLIASLLPAEIYTHFKLNDLTETHNGFHMRLYEYPELVPVSLRGRNDVVLDGFCNPLELLHFSIKGKPLYLKLYRRRWKVSGTEKHYSNRYDFHPEGVKVTHEFATFLKGEARCTADEYVRFLLHT